MSINHKVDTFILGPLAKHNNADSLSLIKIGDTDYTYVAKTDEWKDRVGTLVAWVPPDSVVKLERPEFSFLTNKRVRAKKLRGIISYGLLVTAPEGLKPGDDAAEALEVTHYEPVVRQQGVSFEASYAIPGPCVPEYDQKHFMRFGRRVFIPGEMVYITEKLHGSCGRYMYVDGVMYCGSKNEWKAEFAPPSKLTYDELLEKIKDPVKTQKVFDKVSKTGTRKSLWWLALTQEVMNYCINNPGHCVYGEVFGNVQSLKYGANNDVWFRAFDVLLPNQQWMDAQDFVKLELTKVPHIATMAFDFDEVAKHCEGDSTLAAHIREGVVVKPMKERWDDEIGRVSLKIINPAYLEKN